MANPCAIQPEIMKPEFSPSTINTGTDVAIGTVLATATVTGSALCELPKAMYELFPSASNSSLPVAAGVANTVQTIAPGIGLQWRSYTSTAGWVDQSSKPLNQTAARAIAAGYQTNLEHEFKLVKIGDIPAQRFTLPDINLHLKRRGDPETLKENAISIQFSSFQVGSMSCSVVNNTINVDLGQTLISEVATSPSGIQRHGKSFVLRFDCVAGTYFGLKFTANHPLDNAQGILGLSPDSTAKGVGIQLLDYFGSPVGFEKIRRFGPAQAGANNGVTFSAGYIKTGVLKAGSANGGLTFTLTYE